DGFRHRFAVRRVQVPASEVRERLRVRALLQLGAGAVRFAAIHKVFGASNASKLLLHVPQADRCEAAVAIAYEAQARLRDPVYGCVGHIFALQQQVATLQLQLMLVKAQIAQRLVTSQPSGSQWQGNDDGNPCLQPYSSWESMSSSQSSLNCINHDSNRPLLKHDAVFKEDLSVGGSSNKMWATHAEVGELHDLAFRMAGNL
ncbi:unnamed protein product, partial [Musa textilis]